MDTQRYVVAARKYRPQLFGELVAQRHVADTLRNALLQDRLAHAYLFSGPRGVGKTSAARILAKAINCETPFEARDQAEPCRTCPSCRTFEEGRNLNIIEIDAASNNSVEDVRALREKVLIPPQGARRKVYIIDEVHMLSNAAFNALLKTLEEPPPHVLFIFATTEPHRVLPTILSRCQRFDFRRIPVTDTVRRLREICEAEGIEADEESLVLLARKGDGALRDALSMFDQAVSLCGTTLRYAELARALGVVEVDRYFQLTEAIRQGDRAAVLYLVDDLVREGYDFQEFLLGLAEHFRNLLVMVTSGRTDLVEVSENVRERYVALREVFTEPDLLRLMEITRQVLADLRGSAQPRLLLELALLKMASLPRVTDLQELLRRLEALPEETHPTARTPSSPPPAVQEASDGYRPAPAPPPPKQAAPPPAPSSPTPPPRTTPSQSAPAVSNPFGTPALHRKRPPQARAPKLQKADEADTLVAEVPAVEEVFEDVVRNWPLFVQAVAREDRARGAFLDAARPLRVDGNRLVIGVPARLAAEELRAGAGDLLQTLQLYVPAIGGLHVQVVAPPAEEEPSERSPRERLRERYEEDPLVRFIVDRFGGEPLE